MNTDNNNNKHVFTQPKPNCSSGFTDTATPPANDRMSRANNDAMSCIMLNHVDRRMDTGTQSSFNTGNLLDYLSGGYEISMNQERLPKLSKVWNSR